MEPKKITKSDSASLRGPNSQNVAVEVQFGTKTSIPQTPHPIMDLCAATSPAKTPGFYHDSLTHSEENPSLESNELKSQINSLQAQIEKSARRERNKLVSRNILLLFQLFATHEVTQEMAQTHLRLRDERDLWKDRALRAEQDFTTILQQNKQCQKTIDHLEQVQDELCLTIAEEKTKTQTAVKCRKVAVSSLRDRMKSEKERIWTQVQCREQELQQAKKDLYEARCSRDYSMDRIEYLENSLASLRRDDTI